MGGPVLRTVGLFGVPCFRTPLLHFVPQRLRRPYNPYRFFCYNFPMLTLSQFYESIFGSKTYKISLDAGCTCPNRDGSKGRGGCIFCSESGSGDFASERNLPIKKQIENAKKLVESKVKGRSGNRSGKYIAYFQNFTSTYGDVKSLVRKYNEALECDDVTGLAIATRPDCLSEEILSEIAKIAETHFVQVELGLQTSKETTES